MIQSTADTQLEIDRALCRSILYDVLCECLSTPTQATMDRLSSVSTREAICEAAQEIGAAAAHATRELFSQAAQCDARELAEEFQRLFGHTAHGQVPPYETEYGSDDMFRQSEELADLGGFYRGFGLTLPPTRSERPDHVCAECEFLSFLACKEAYERIEARQEALEVVQRAEKLFLKEHLGRFGRAFALSLEKHTRHAFYRASAGLFLELLAHDCKELGIEQGQEFLAIREGRDDGVPMACGSSCPLLTSEPSDAEDGT